MRLLPVLILFFLHLTSFGQDCHRAYWVDGYDGSQAFEHFIDVDRHPDGGFVVCGKHSADGTTLGNQNINTGAYGYYLARMDSAGNFSQLTSLFSQDGIALKRITVLPDGSVAAGCTVNANITLGNETFHIHGGAKPLLIKFDDQFNYQWHRAAENTSNSTEMRDISCDSQGNIFWGGLFSSNDLSFGGTFHLHRTTDGGAWLSKVSSEGQFQWIKGIAPGVSAGLQTVTVDSNDDVWISGQASIGANNVLKFSDQIIAPGYLNSAWCTYVAKFDTQGVCLWGKASSSTTTTGSIYTTDAMADDNGNMYICGQFTGTYEWYGLPMIGGDGSGYLWKLDTQGNGLWIKTMGGQGSNESAAALDVRGDRIAVVGYLSSNQPYVGNFPVYSLATGTYKAFNAQFYSNGELEFCRMNQNDTQNFMQHDVVIDEGLNQIVFGYYKGTNIAWYPFSLTHTGTNPKMFVAKFGASNSTSFSITAGPDKTTTCGTTVLLSASTTPTNGVGFGWWPDLGFSNNYSKSPGINIATPNDYIFYGYYQGCVLRDTVHVNLSNHALTINAGNDLAHCFGDTTQLLAISNDPTATIAWTPNYRLTATNTINTNSFTNTSLNYVVEATVGSCKARDTVFVQVHRKPAIDLPYQQFYQSYQMHTCIDLPVYADLGASENTYSFDNETHITWQNDHSVIFDTEAYYYGGIITAVSPEGCQNQITYTVYVYDYQMSPPILNQPHDTIYLCPATGYVYEEEFMITTDIQYLPEEFNFSWYSGWQVDSLDGLGWRDIEYWNYGHYELFPNSVGFPTSAYYVPLRFWNVEPEMDGYKYRAYIHDICSPRSYTEEMVLRVGPAFTAQSAAVTICEGASDTLFVQAANNNGLYQWQVFRDNAWMDITVDESHLQVQNNHLIIVDAVANMDSLFRCRIEGCSPASFTYSASIPITIQLNAIDIAGPFQSEGCLGDTIALHIAATGGNFTMQWMRDGSILDVPSSGHAGVDNDTLWINTSIYDPIGHNYACQLFNTQCAQNFSTADWTVSLNLPTTIVWEPETIGVCVSDSAIFIANAWPSGGAYSGPGLVGQHFDPQLTGPGSSNLTYTYSDESTGCISTAQQAIYVWNLPNVQLQLSQNEMCINDLNNAIDVVTSPSGGDLLEVGLDFNPSQTGFARPEGAGTYIIEYTYTDEHGCANTVETPFLVLDTATLNWVDQLGTFCITEANVPIAWPQPEGGTFTNFEVIGQELSLGDANAGDYYLTYNYTNTNGCISSRNAAFEVQEIMVQWNDSLLSGCISGSEIPLGHPTPTGGVFAHEAVIDTLFSPSIAGIGFHAVTYTYTDETTGCSGSQTQYVQVYDQPAVDLSGIASDFCIGQSVWPLEGGMPMGGIYVGEGVTEAEPGLFSLETANLNPGFYELTYLYTDASGCSNSATVDFAVHASPSVAWVDSLGSFCTNTVTAAVATPEPAGGIFSPEWASWGQLQTQGLQPGSYNVEYTWVDDFGCTAHSTAVFHINDTLEVSWAATSPGEPNNGFYFCGNYAINAQADLTNSATPAGGSYYNQDDYLENNTWTWGEFFEPGFYPILYTVEDAQTGCLSTSVQSFQLDLCGGVDGSETVALACWSDGYDKITISSPSSGTFEVLTSTGQLVYTGQLIGGMQTKTIATAGGMYVVRMKSGAQVKVQKLALGF